MSAREPGSSRLPAWAPKLRRVLLWLIGALYLASVPWYRGDGPDGRLLGLPAWVGFALLCYVAVALLNSLAWLLTDIEDAQPPGDPNADHEAGAQ